MPAFVHHGIVNHAQHHFPAAAEGDGHAKPRNGIEIIHRAVNGVHDPFVFAVPVSGVTFLPQYSVSRESGEDFLRDQFLGQLVQFQLDVVLAGFIHLLPVIKMLFQEGSGGLGRPDGYGHFRRVVHDMFE